MKSRMFENLYDWFIGIVGTAVLTNFAIILIVLTLKLCDFWLKILGITLSQIK